MEPLKKLFKDLFSLILFNGIIVWLLYHFGLIRSNGVTAYILLAAGGLVLCIVVNLLATFGLKFFQYQYYRFLLMGDSAIFNPDVVWNNFFVRSTIYWGLVGALLSTNYAVIAVIAIVAQLGLRIKSGLPNMGNLKMSCRSAARPSPTVLIPTRVN
ncbi:hypothetical protein [Mucilaginibacter antarcticus]|uniref:hypothetical protein n=1 Tax=Mucilaginibacter antarcticus TaxID=1855725 RepID=UPI00363432B2